MVEITEVEDSSTSSDVDLVEDEEDEQQNAPEQETKKVPIGEWQTLMGDDLVLKVTEALPPIGKDKAEDVKHGDTVIIDFVIRKAETKDETDGPVVQQAEGWLIELGAGDVLPALEMGIRFLQTGQKGIVWSHSKYGFATGIRRHGEYTLSPMSNILVELHVKQMVMDTSRLNPYFPIQKALTRKKIANDIYQNEYSTGDDAKIENGMSTGRCIRLYQKAANDMQALLEGTYFASVERDHPQRAQCKQILLDCLNNVTAVFLRQGDYHKAKEAAVKALEVDNSNIKALLRAAKAALLDPASTLEEAQAALKAADGAITYKNPAEEKELKRLQAQYKKKAKEYKETTRAMFANKLKSDAKPTDASETAAAGACEGPVKSEAGEEKKESTSASSGASTDHKDNETQGVSSNKSKILPYAIQVGLTFVMFAIAMYLRQKNESNREQEL